MEEVSRVGLIKLAHRCSWHIILAQLIDVRRILDKATLLVLAVALACTSVVFPLNACPGPFSRDMGLGVSPGSALRRAVFIEIIVHIQLI